MPADGRLKQQPNYNQGACLFNVTTDQLRANLAQSKNWSETRDLPDPVGLADLRQRFDLVAPLVSFARPPAVLTSFPWPNAGTKIRSMAVVDPYDELTIRVAVGEFVAVVDDFLPARPTVAGYRIAKRPPGWTFRHPKGAHSEHRDHVAGLVEARNFGCLVVTDVARCYGSIRVSAVAEQLMMIVGKHPAVDASLGWLRIWTDRDGCEGLPIGPEWSPIFAHSLLARVDHALVTARLPHGRWSDDIAISVPSGFDPAALDLVDEQLQLLGLERSVEKTFIYDDPAAALAKVRNTALSGLEGMLATLDPAADGHVHDLFSASTTADDGLSPFRFAVKVMKHRCDPWAAGEFARDPTLMEIDPTTVGSYLAALSRKHPDAVARLFCLLADAPTDRSAAVQVHLLKAATSRHWGAAEGRLFEAVHDAVSASDVLRWWSAEALAATPAFDLTRCVADVDAQSRGCGSRRMALPTRRAIDERQRRSCAKRIGALSPHLAATAAFIERRADPIT